MNRGLEHSQTYKLLIYEAKQLINHRLLNNSPRKGAAGKGWAYLLVLVVGEGSDKDMAKGSTKT